MVDIDIYHPLSTVSDRFWDQYGNPIFFPYLPSTLHTNLTRILAFLFEKGDKNKPELASILLNRVAVLKMVKLALQARPSPFKYGSSVHPYRGLSSFVIIYMYE